MINHVIQTEKNECGIACIKMILDYFDIKINYDEIKSSININENGVVLSDLYIFLKQFKDFEAYKVDDEKQIINFLPAILLVKKHYLILWWFNYKYCYISDPADYKIRKIRFKRLKKKRINALISSGNYPVEIKDLIHPKFKLKFKKYSIPYILLLILELFLLTFSMFYLFSIEDFTVFKILFFLIVTFIICIISFLKNYFINKIHQFLDTHVVDKTIYHSFDLQNEDIYKVKMVINNAYQLKIRIFTFLSSFIPGIIILGISLLTFLLIDYILATIIFIVMLIIFNLYYLINKKKNKILYSTKLEEKEFNQQWEINFINPNEKNKEEMFIHLENIKKKMSIYGKYEQLQGMAINILKQAILMLILIYCYSNGLDQYIVFIVAFLFYTFDSILQISDYCSGLLEYKIIMLEHQNLFKKIKKNV